MIRSVFNIFRTPWSLKPFSPQYALRRSFSAFLAFSSTSIVRKFRATISCNSHGVSFDQFGSHRFSGARTACSNSIASSSAVTAHAATKSSPRASRRMSSSALWTMSEGTPFSAAQLQFRHVRLWKPRILNIMSHIVPKLCVLRPSLKLVFVRSRANNNTGFVRPLAYLYR